MRTRMNGGPEFAMTSQEAEAVLTLLDQRRQEMEALRARTTVQDLAEAAAVPTEEIEALLAHVRRSAIRGVENRKVRRYPFLIAAAVVAWVTILASGFSFVFWRGKMKGYSEGRNSLTYGRQIVHLSSDRIVVNTSPVGAKNLPPNISVSYDQYKVVGENKDAFINEDVLAATFDSIVEERQGMLDPSDRFYAYDQLQRLDKALETGSTKGVEDILEYKEIEVTVDGEKFSKKVPVSKNGSGTATYKVDRERARVLGILANEVYLKLKGASKS